MKNVFVVLCAVCALLAVLPDQSWSQLPPVRERLGLRTGYIQTLGGLQDNFGAGGHLTLHFTERTYDHLYFDLRVAAMYLGDSKHPEIAKRVTANDNTISEMRILYFSIGPNYTFDLAEYWTGYLSAGAGIYSVSILFDSGIQAYDYSDQHFGFNGGGGILWRFTDTWNLDLGFTVHHFYTEKKRSDLFWVFTGEGAANPTLLEFSAGICIDLR
jgi:opacity protein-like surface antigen